MPLRWRPSRACVGAKVVIREGLRRRHAARPSGVYPLSPSPSTLKPAAPPGAGRCRRARARGRPLERSPHSTHKPGQSGSRRRPRSAPRAGSPRGPASARSSSWWSVSRAASGSSSVAAACRSRCRSPAGPPPRPASRSGSRSPGGSGCTRAERRREVGVDEHAAVGAREIERAPRSARRGAGLVERDDRDARDLVAALRAGSLGEEASDVPDGQRLIRPASASHRRQPAARRPPSSCSTPPRRARRRPRRGRRAAPPRRSSSIAMPFLMLWSVLHDLGLEADQHARRVLVGAAPDVVARRAAPRRSIRRLSASARLRCSPRSSIRNAACSWARATIRSASSLAFSMIRSPSALIRFAAWTSSGTATRSWSMSSEGGVLVDEDLRGEGQPCRSRSATRAARRGT